MMRRTFIFDAKHKARQILQNKIMKHFNKSNESTYITVPTNPIATITEMNLSGLNTKCVTTTHKAIRLN